jgi:hypothetical protein
MRRERDRKPTITQLLRREFEWTIQPVGAATETHGDIVLERLLYVLAQRDGGPTQGGKRSPLGAGRVVPPVGSDPKNSRGVDGAGESQQTEGE